MAKNIQWKKSTLDYNKLNKLTPQSLANSSNAKCVNREKLGKILSESYKNNPEMQTKMKECGSTTSLMRLERGDYESEKYLEIMRANGNKHVASGHLDNIRPKATKASIESRVKLGKERKLRILEHIPFGVEFEISKDLKPICIELNEVNLYWNKIVNDCDLVEKVYKGTSRIDPPRFKRLK
jgi:hypothetical protein|tara:strand:- start:48 stop:593 length:546 start_codon:yes stop_codon:yes gene_type:complete